MKEGDRLTVEPQADDHRKEVLPTGSQPMVEEGAERREAAPDFKEPVTQ